MDDAEPDEILGALGLPPATTHARMSGFDATVWRADLVDGRTVALRWLREGASPGRELAAQRLAGALAQPVPVVIATGVCRSRAAVVTSWCAGRPIGDLLADGADPARLGVLFGRAHARLHAPVPACDPLAAIGPSPALAATPVDADAPPVLAHLDYQPFNVLADGARVTGIIDWSNASLTDRRADIARTRAVLAIAHTIVAFPAETIATFTAAWQAGYAEVRPMPNDSELAPFVAAAGAALGTEWAPRVVQGKASLAVLEAIDDLVSGWAG